MNTQDFGNDIEEIYPLSPMQQGMLFHSMHAPDTGVYIIQWCCTFEMLHSQAFAQAWQAMLERHSILRTAFVWEGLEEMLQVVGSHVELPWTELDWRTLTPEEQQTRIAILLQQERSTGFEMNHAPLMRFILIRLTDRATRFIWSFHHALLDGWSAGILLNDLFTCYAAFTRGELLELPPAHRYGEYIEWLQRQDLEAAEAFWRKALQGFTNPVKLQFDRDRGEIGQARLEMKLSQTVTQKLVDLARHQHITLNTVVQGVWTLLLNRYSGQDDIVFGMTIAGRPTTLPGAEQMVGLFINTLPLRIQVTPDASLIPWLQNLQEKQISLHQYQYTPLAQIQGWSQIPRGAPLFESILGFSNYPGSSTQGIDHALEIREVSGIEQTSYPLGLVVLPGQQLALRLVYDRQCFSETTATQILAHMQMLFESIAENPEQCLRDFSLLTPGERQQILGTWNATQKLYPDEECFHHLFERQAAQSPDVVALAFEEIQLTYGVLNQRANQLAHFLHSLGVGSEVTVGLAINRSLEMIVALLGILKAGGVYLPLDPAYPIERLAYIIEDAQLSLILTSESASTTLPTFAGRILYLDQEWPHIEQERIDNPGGRFHQDQLAYVIYTSGTTGRPKGTLITQRGLRNLPVAQGQVFGMQMGNRALQFGSLNFDGSIGEISTALAHGATLHLSTKERMLPGVELLAYLREQAISDLVITPTALAAMACEELPALRTLVVAGEACPAGLVALWGKGRRFFNAYGPTECTVCATIAACRAEEEVPPIGHPIFNVQTYVLDGSLKPVPVGVPGELYLGGTTLARGYHHRPDLTAERFIPHPFCSIPGQRLYRTGDRVRYLPDGRLEFLGRCDEQIKLRGFRIELKEIEEILRTHASVRNAVVVVREDSTRTRQLVAYFTPEKQGLTTSILRNYLQEWLPDYMLPAFFIALPELPRTPNGKIDIHALPAPESIRPDLDEDLVAPTSHVEQILAQIWADVLYMDEVGIHDNFFSLGGDSILSIQIVSKALEAGIRLTTMQIFEHPTIARLSAVVDTSGVITAEQEPVSGPVPLTPIQQWFFEQKLSNPHHWNMPMLLSAKHPLQPELLKQALNVLQDHHDVLRLRFHQKDDGWQQICVAPSSHTSLLQVCDLSAFVEEEQQRLFKAAVERCQQSLNISEGPLLQGILFQRGEQGPDLLFLAVHHLAVDGVSWRILLQDLQMIYTQLVNGGKVTLPAKTTSYKQWSERLRAYSNIETLQQERDYWARQVHHSSAMLPVDQYCGPNVERSMASVLLSLSPEETQQLLQQVPEVYHTEINDILLTALVQCLARWIGSSTLAIDLEGHGREELFADLDLSRTVGWFTSFFPVCLELPERADPGTCLKAIKEQLRRIPQHGIGYGLLRYLQASAEQTSPLPIHPRPEVCFNYLGQFNQASMGDAPLLAFAQAPTGYDHDPDGLRDHLLEINGLVHAGQFQIAWTYSKNIHRAATIERLAEDYMRALRGLIHHCLSPEAGGYTPSDFPLARLDERQLQMLEKLANRAK